MTGFRSAVGGSVGSGQAARPGGGPEQPPRQKAAPTDHDTEKSRWWSFGLTTWLLIIGLIIINAGMFVKPELLESVGGRLWRVFSFFDFRSWPWWYWPIFWIIVIGVMVRYLIGERITVAEYNKEPTDQLGQLRRLTTITVIGLAVVLVVIHTRLVLLLGSLLGNMFSSNAPWWAWPAFWIVVIVGLVAFKIVMVTQDPRLSNSQGSGFRSPAAALPPQPAPAKQKTFNAVTAQAPAAKRTFNAATGPRTSSPREKWSFSKLPGISALADLGPLVWWILGGIVVFILLAWFGYWYTTTEWIDKEGYPISKPWWIWPLLFALIGCGVFVFKMIGSIREGAAEGAFRRDKPKFTLPTKPQKPTGFNVQRKK